MLTNIKSKYLTYSIKGGNYFHTENSKYLFEVSKLKKPGFSVDGADLTICILSLNRIQLTIKLLMSIEYYLDGFKGEVLIVDNNSAAEQKEKLKEFIATSSLSIRMEELKENLGVGRARNYAAGVVQTSWLMFLDNDMFFVKNPLPGVKRTIEEMGVHFCNLPLINYDNKTVFALGGALFTWPMEKGHFTGGGSCFNFKREVEYEEIDLKDPFLSDFLFGGASIVNREYFLELGGFDKDMFVGFEDIDFSLKLYNKGIKVANVNEFPLVHNHKPSADINDLEAERKRFNNGVIKASAEAFEKKNGLIVYDHHTEEWLKQKQEELNINGTAAKKQTDAKKRIALIVDVKDWAFHNIAKNIEKHLSHKYEFTIYFQSEYAWEKWLDIYPILYREAFDALLFFWRPVYKHLFSKDLMHYLDYQFGISRTAFEKFLNDTILLTGVYDHLYLSEDEAQKHADIFTNDVDGYFVSSNKLKAIYENIDGYTKPYTVIQDGVDTVKFFRKPGKSFSTQSESLVVGWAGNSAWGVSEDGIDHKGFSSIIRPAIEELIKEGFPVKLIYADKQEPETHIHPSEMNSFYNNLDVYICASDIEGTPNPVLESMAAGIAIVTTDVGIVSEVFGRKQKEFILKERTKDCLKERLKVLINNRHLLSELADENKVRINNWTWESKCERFDEMFEYFLNKKESGRLHYKKFPYGFTASLVEEVELFQEMEDMEVGQLMPSNMAVSTEQDALGKELAVDKEEHERILENLRYYRYSYDSIKGWYQKEYEVLPLWYKRLGHIIKVFKGERSFGSLLKKG